MATTHALIYGAFPTVLGDIIADYFKAKDGDPTSWVARIAKAGNYELCMLLSISFGPKAIEYACRGGHIELARNIARSCVYVPMYAAYRSGDACLIAMAEATGEQSINTALEGACAGGHAALVAALLERGASNHDRGLVATIKRGNIAIAELLIEHVSQSSKQRALDAACYYGHVDMIEYLLQHGTAHSTQSYCIATDRGYPGCARLVAANGPSNQMVPIGSMDNISDDEVIRRGRNMIVDYNSNMAVIKEQWKNARCECCETQWNARMRDRYTT